MPLLGVAPLSHELSIFSGSNAAPDSWIYDHLEINWISTGYQLDISCQDLSEHLRMKVDLSKASFKAALAVSTLGPMGFAMLKLP